MPKFAMITLAGFVAGAAAVGGSEYRALYHKWYALGVNSGKIAGRSSVMNDLCKFATPDKPGGTITHAINVKANYLGVARRDGALVFYCR